MNILIINTGDIRGGAAKIAYSLKQGMSKLGHNCDMFVSSKSSQDKNVHVIPKTEWQRRFSYYFATDLNFWKTDWILQTEIFKKADIIHCHNLHGNYFNLNTLKKMAALKPVIWTLHDMWAMTPHCAHAFDGKIKNGLFTCPSLDIYPKIAWHNELYLSWKKNKIYNSSKFHVVVPSKWLMQKAEQSVLQSQKISLIYNGIDTNIFHQKNKMEMKRKLGLPENKMVIAFLADSGKNNPWKGWEYTENIIKSDFIDAHFICIGGEKPKENPNDKVQYINYIKDEATIAEYLSASDIFLYPSLADSFPLVVIEALSCGTPVVTFKTGGIPEIVSHKENGYVAKYMDIDDLKKGLLYIKNLSLKDSEAMINRSIEKIAKNFSADEMVANYLSVYQSELDSINKLSK